MPRYIDAEHFDCISWKGIPEGYDDTFDSGVLYMADLIDEQPTVSPDDARGVGKWIEETMRIKCSVCRTDFNDEVTCCFDCYRWPWRFCPNCGAKMEVSEDA